MKAKKRKRKPELEVHHLEGLWIDSEAFARMDGRVRDPAKELFGFSKRYMELAALVLDPEEKNAPPAKKKVQKPAKVKKSR